MDRDRSASFPLEEGVAGDVIQVAVCIENQLDREPALANSVPDRLATDPGVDNHRASTGRTDDDVRVFREWTVGEAEDLERLHRAAPSRQGLMERENNTWL
jgi:hypothetical protein